MPSYNIGDYYTREDIIEPKIDLLCTPEDTSIELVIIIHNDDFKDDDDLWHYIKQKMTFYYYFIHSGQLLNNFPDSSGPIVIRFCPKSEFTYWTEEKIANFKFVVPNGGSKYLKYDHRISDVGINFDYSKLSEPPDLRAKNLLPPSQIADSNREK